VIEIERLSPLRSSPDSLVDPTVEADEADTTGAEGNPVEMDPCGDGHESSLDERTLPTY
jgi:hypothetical protein